MGSPENPPGELPAATSAPAPPTPSKPSDSNTPTKPPAAAAVPNASVAEVATAAAAAAAEWSKAMQAYYGPGAVVAPQAFYPSPPWGTQMMGHYGPPGAIAYAPFYAQPPPGAMYAQQHPLPLGMAYPEGMMNKSSGSKGTADLAGNSGRGTSGSHDDAARSPDSDTVGSSDTREEGVEDKNPSITKKRTYDMLAAEAETTNPTTPSQYIGAESSSYSGRVRSAKKLPVSAPGRAALPDPQTNLSIGMDIWGSPNSGPTTVKVGSNEQQWLQDERDLRRERRKQSNRESARRSRLRKQQECEELGRKVSELTDENNSLREEVDHLKKFCDELTAENKSLEEELTQQHGPNFLLVLGVGANPSTNGHFHHNPMSSQKNGTSGDNPESTSN